MLTLYGFAASNYYNKVKLALMEKGIAFEEALRWPDQTDGEISPLHKVPYLKDGDHGMWICPHIAGHGLTLELMIPSCA